MNQKRRVIVLATALGAVLNSAPAGCARHIATDSGRATTGSRSVKEPSAQEADDFRSLVSSLSSYDDNVRLQAERQLIAVKDSPTKRAIVIKEFLNSIAMNQELDGTHPTLTSTFVFWRSATNVLARLRAEEAIDSMIRCIHCSNGLSGNDGEPPASYALYEMGDLAVPKLGAVLMRESDRYKRFKIVLCLSRIDSPAAHAALKRALEVERDKAIRNDIKRALSDRKAAKP